MRYFSDLQRWLDIPSASSEIHHSPLSFFHSMSSREPPENHPHSKKKTRKLKSPKKKNRNRDSQTDRNKDSAGRLDGQASVAILRSPLHLSYHHSTSQSHHKPKLTSLHSTLLFPKLHPNFVFLFLFSLRSYPSDRLFTQLRPYGPSPLKAASLLASIVYLTQTEWSIVSHYSIKFNSHSTYEYELLGVVFVS